MKLFDENGNRLYVFMYCEGEHDDYTETVYLSKKEIPDEELKACQDEYLEKRNAHNKFFKDVNFDSGVCDSNGMTNRKLSDSEYQDALNKRIALVAERGGAPWCPNLQSIIEEKFDIEVIEIDKRFNRND